MNKIEQMITELCPEGVEFKTLGEVCKIIGRIGFRGYTRDDLVNKSEGAISLSPSNIVNERMNYDKCTYISWVKYDESPEIKIEEMDILFCKTASIGKTALVKALPKEATINPQLVVLKKIRCDNAFLSYILKSDDFQKQVHSIKGVGSVPTLSQAALAKLIVPVPPIAIQREIVNILDKFTKLEAELEAELEARRKQYEFYRSKLLTFNDINGRGHKWLTLSDVGEFYGGLSGKSKNDFSDGNARYITYMNVFSNISISTEIDDFVKIAPHERQNKVKYGDIVFTGSSETPEECGMSSVMTRNEDDLYLNSFCFGLRLKDEYKEVLMPEFSKYLFRSKDVRAQIIGTANGVTRFNVSKKRMGQVKIPILPLEEQNRIVAILDKFEKLVNDISEGLPAEIKARRQQYEHYRNKLLTFKQAS